MIQKQKNIILITWALWLIGKILINYLSEKYNIIGIDKIKSDWIYGIDITNYKKLHSFLNKIWPINTVIHLAWAKRMQNIKDIYNTNVVWTQNLYQISKELWVKKIIFASSNNVMWLYEWDPNKTLHLDKINSSNSIIIDASETPNPDSYYSWSKLIAEELWKQLSQLSNIQVVNLRIWSVKLEDNPSKNNRHRSTWLSHRDLCNLFETLIAWAKTNKKYATYFWVSNNKYNFWELNSLKKDYWYTPKDNAEIFY